MVHKTPDPKERSKREEGPLILWTTHCATPEQKKEFHELMAISNGPCWKRLLDIVREQRERTIKASLKSSNYDSPSWAYVQADNVGYQRALDLMEHLIKGIVK